jgi:hypothetical protein
MDHQYLEDKLRFIQRLRLLRVYDEALATSTFFAPWDHRPKPIRAKSRRRAGVQRSAEREV